MTRTLHGTLLITLLATACVTGVKPPERTKLVPVQGGAYLFGTTEMCFPVGTAPVTCAQAGVAQDASGLPPTFPTVTVDLKPFAIEEHEVTNLQYRYCFEMGACDDPDAYNSGNIGDYYGNPAYDDYPVVGVRPAMAEQYCAFVERRLPTEAEWERAAAGAATTEPAKRRSTIEDGAGRLENCSGKSVQLGLCNGEGAPRAVKASSDDRVTEQGQEIWDLTGNVGEWVAGYWRLDQTCADVLPASCDCYACGSADTACKEDCYTKCTPCDEAGAACYTMCPVDFLPHGIPRCLQFTTTVPPARLVLDSGSERTYRGGSFLTKGNNICKARVSDRSQHASPSQGLTNVGFRCAKDM